MAEPKILHDIVNNMCLSFYCHIIWSYFSSCKAHWQVYWSRSWLSYFSLGGCCWSFFVCFFIFFLVFCVSLSSRSLPVTGYAKVAKRLPSGYRMRNVYGILVSLLCWHGISWSFRVSSCPASKEFQFFVLDTKPQSIFKRIIIIFFFFPNSSWPFSTSSSVPFFCVFFSSIFITVFITKFRSKGWQMLASVFSQRNVLACKINEKKLGIQHLPTPNDLGMRSTALFD